MMDTLALTETGSTTSMHVQVHLDGQSPQLEQQRHHLNQQQQHNIVSLGDISELTHELHEDIVSIPKEVVLISLVAQEQALYNPKHEYYRNSHRKDAKWMEIAETVGWSEAQCKSKWKAMRDQYCRELKRSKFNAKANVKWRYFKELDFLRPFALSRNYRPRANTTIAKSDNLTGCNASGNIKCNKLPSIKIENGQFTSCEFNTDENVLDAEDKHEATTTRLLTSLTDEQLNSVMQQHSGSWNYLTAANTTDTRNMQAHQHSVNELDDNNLLQHAQQHSGADDMLCALVESVTAAAGQMHQSQSHNDEEDDDPIHTFLNMEGFFEKDLISMVQQEDILYNNFHPNYRNSKVKLEVWDEIAQKLKKPIGRCRLKWKALRDQYIREHKRLKDRENSASLPRWKHYDALSFLKKFIKHKTRDFDAKNIVQLPKNETDTDLEEQIIDSSPLRSPAEVAVEAHELESQTLPTLSGPHTQHHQHQHQHQHQLQHDICVVSGSSVGGYDEMDIDHYIIGHASDTGVNDDGDDMDAEDDDEDRKSHQHFPDYAPSSTSNTTINNNSNQPECGNNLERQENEYKDIKENNAEQQGVTLQQQQQHQPQEQQTLLKVATQSTQQHHQSQQQQHHHQQQQQHLLTLEVGGESHTATLTTSDESIIQHQQHDYANDMKQQQLPQQTHAHGLINGGNTNLTANNNSANVLGENCGMAAIINASASLSMDSINLQTLTNSSPMTSSVSTAATSGTMSGAVPIAAAVTSTSTIANPTSTEHLGDDEVGAFFKAVAMKIRSAKMSPVAFTDLQIDILRVINETLRNH
ncbi:uncharacterized protein LOC129241221 [Anastrepha obliqua]|uniref:uncharacterized protein LOC129241221 n=1 Tax=Anastrepha obliqua TaxID=95512 RepID=UPI00240A4F9C|nr:uncharacterized protein LOC129241221 [Anastrepha obliqua]